MKKLVILIILILCVGCNKEEERVINVLNWSSYIPNEVIEDFEKETGIKVNYSTYSSNEELLAKVSSAKEGTYDLVFPSDYMIEIMRSRDILDKIDLNKLLNFSNINPKYLNLEYDTNNEYSIPFIAATTVIAVNRDIIKDEINSYNDLLNEKYKNEIVLIDDQRIIIGMGLLANGYNMSSTNEEELSSSKEWLLKLRSNLKAYDSDSPKNFLITIDNFAILKGAKHKEDTYLFIDYILRADVMKKIVEAYPYKNINIRTNEILSNNYLLNEAANISDENMEKGYFVKNIGEKIKLYDKIWAEIK